MKKYYFLLSMLLAILCTLSMALYFSLSDLTQNRLSECALFVLFAEVYVFFRKNMFKYSDLFSKRSATNNGVYQ